MLHVITRKVEVTHILYTLKPLFEWLIYYVSTLFLLLLTGTLPQTLIKMLLSVYKKL